MSQTKFWKLVAISTHNWLKIAISSSTPSPRKKQLNNLFVIKDDIREVQWQLTMRISNTFFHTVTFRNVLGNKVFNGLEIPLKCNSSVENERDLLFTGTWLQFSSTSIFTKTKKFYKVVQRYCSSEVANICSTYTLYVL